MPNALLTTQDLREALAVVAGQVVLKAETLNSTDVTWALDQYFPNQTLTIAGASIQSQPHDDFVLVKGTIELLGVAVTGTVKFYMGSNGAELELVTTLPPGWRFGDSFVDLKKDHFNDFILFSPGVTLLSKADGNAVRGLLFDAGFTLPPVLEALKWFADPGAAGRLSGVISLVNGLPLTTLSVTPRIQVLLGGYLAVELEMQHLARIYPKARGKAVVSTISQLSGKLSFTHDAKAVDVLITALFNRDLSVLYFRVFTGEVFDLGLSAIAHWINGVDLSSQGMPSAYNPVGLTLHDVCFAIGVQTKTLEYVTLRLQSTEPWTIVADKVEIEKIQIDFMVMQPQKKPASIQATIAGELKLGSVIMDIYAQIPDFLVRGSLAEDSPIDLIPLIDHMGGVSEGMPAELKIDELNLEAHPAGDFYSLQIDINGNWPIAGSLELRDIGASVAYQKGGDDGNGVSTVLKGMFTVSGVDLEVTAEHNAATPGWLFSGETGHGQEIPIGPLIDDLASQLSLPITLPEALTGLTVSNIATKYDSGAKELSFSCESKMRIDRRDVDLTVAIVRRPKQDAAGKADGHEIVFGGVLWVGELKFELDYSADGTLKGSTSDNVEISVTKAVGEVFELFGFDLPDFLPDVTLENVTISYNTTTKAFDVGGRDKGASHINLGSVTYGIDNAILDLGSSIDATTGARKYNGFLRGEIMIGGATFEGEFDFGKQAAWKGTWDKSASGGSLQFADLAESHGIDHSLKPPNGLALDLDRAAFEYDVWNGRFTLSADSKFGQAFFIVSNANGDWDFAFGIEIKLSDMNVPAIGGVELKDVILVLSTVKDDNFIVPTLPEVPSAGTPASNGRTFPNLGTHKMPLQPGVSVAALLDFNSGDILTNFGSAIGKSELLVQAEIKSNTDDAGQTTQPSVMFTAWLDGSLTIFGNGSEKLVIMNPRVQLSAAGETFGLRLGGTVLIAIQHVTLHATGALEVTDAGMDAVLQVQGESDGKPAELPFPFGLLGVRLTELDIEVGVDFEPPGVELGIQGKFNISGQQPSKNDFAIVLNIEGEVPNPRYLGSHVEHLTIADMVHAYTGNADSIPLPDFLKVIHGDDLSVYWAEEPGIVLPDGTPTQEGFGFDGTLTIGSFTIHAKLAVGTASGVAGDGELPPIDWAKGVLKLTGNGLGVIRNNKQVIPKGGATIVINSKSSPYLHISAKATLFNIISKEVEIEVTNSGFKFKQSTTIGSVYRAEFDCELSKSGFKAHGEFKVGINGDIGPIHILGINCGSIGLDVDFETTLDVSVHEHDFSLSVSGTFEFEGIDLTMPSFTISASFTSLEDLPGKIFDQIKNEADEIFKSIFNAAGKLIGPVIEEAEKMGAAVADEAREIAAGAEVAAVKFADDAKAAFDSAKQTAEAAAQTAVQLEHEAEQVLSDAATEVAKIGDEALADVKQIGEEATRVAQAALDEIENIEQALVNIPVIKAAEEAFAAAEKLGKEIGAEAERDCQAIKDAAEQTIDAIDKEAEKAVAAIRDEAKKIGNEIADGAKAAVGWVSNAGSTMVEAVSHY